MSIDRSAPDLDRPGAAAPAAPAARAAARDAVLRGLVHALSNRVGTVVAVASMLDPEAPAAGAAATILREEGGRLETLLEEFRRFAGEPGELAEPLYLPELVALAVALHAHHPTLRDVPCEVVGVEALPPALGAPSAVVDALLVALGAAKEGAGEGGRAVRVVGAADGDVVRLHVGEVGGTGDVVWALPGERGRAWAGMGGGGVELPTLAAGRGQQR